MGVERVFKKATGAKAHVRACLAHLERIEHGTKGKGGRNLATAQNTCNTSRALLCIHPVVYI